MHLRTGARDEVLAEARELAAEGGTRMLVAPEIDGWVSVYPIGHGQDPQLVDVLARRIGCPVLHAAVAEDRVLSLKLWIDGEPRSDLPVAFAELGVSDSVAVTELLGLDEGPAHHRLARLAGWLELSNAIEAYEFLMAGEIDEVVGWDEFIELPAGFHPIVPQALADTDVRLMLDSDRLGVWTRDRFWSRRAGDGFFLAGHDPRFCGSDLRMRELPFEIDGAPVCTACDGHASRGVVMTSDTLYVVDWRRYELITELNARSHTSAIAFRNDGRLIAHAGWNSVIVVDVGTAESRKLKSPSTQSLAFCGPDWLAVADRDLVLLPVRGDPRDSRRLLLPGPVGHAPLPTAPHLRLLADSEVVGEAGELSSGVVLPLLPRRVENRWTTGDRVESVFASHDDRWLYVGTRLGVSAWLVTDCLDRAAQLPPPRWSLAGATLIDALPDGRLFVRADGRHVWVDGERGSVLSATNIWTADGIAVSTDGSRVALQTSWNVYGRPPRHMWEVWRVVSTPV